MKKIFLVAIASAVLASIALWGYHYVFTLDDISYLAWLSDHHSEKSVILHETWSDSAQNFAPFLAVGLGYAFLLCAILIKFMPQDTTMENLRSRPLWGLQWGVLWGLGGFLVFALSPAIVLPAVAPPAHPNSALLELRQLLWLLQVGAAAFSFWLIRNKQIAFGVLLILFVTTLNFFILKTSWALSFHSLTFTLHSLVGWFLFWCVLGASCGSLLVRIKIPLAKA